MAIQRRGVGVFLGHQHPCALPACRAQKRTFGFKMRESPPQSSTMADSERRKKGCWLTVSGFIALEVCNGRTRWRCCSGLFQNKRTSYSAKTTFPSLSLSLRQRSLDGRPRYRTMRTLLCLRQRRTSLWPVI